MSEINIRRPLARLQEATDTADEQSLITQSCAAIDALKSELEVARRDAESWYEQAQARTADAVQFSAERDALAARLAELEAQEPLFWYRPCGDLYEGPVHHNSVGGKMLRDEKPGEWHGLYAHSIPVEQPVNARLLAIAMGQLQHVYAGGCPDAAFGWHLRDPECPACQVITSAEAQQVGSAMLTNDERESIWNETCGVIPGWRDSLSYAAAYAAEVETAVLRKNGIEVAE